MKKIIDFTDRVLKMIETIQEREGQRTFSATVQSIISQYHEDKFFSKYKENNVKQKEVKHYTPEEICEKLNGFVYNNVCKISDGNLHKQVPLSLMGTGEYIIKE